MPRPIFPKPGPSLTEADIAAVEAELKVTLPEPYRRFLLQTNGGQPVPDAVGTIPVNAFCGLKRKGAGDLIFYTQLCWDTDIPDDLIAIAYGVFGHTVCLGMRGDRLGKVYVHDQEFGTLTLYAEDFETFLDSFYEPDLSDLDKEAEEE